MQIIIDYTDKTRETIIARQKVEGFMLIEDQKYFDGNHLVFDNGIPKLVRNPLVEIDEIKAMLIEKGILEK